MRWTGDRKLAAALHTPSTFHAPIIVAGPLSIEQDMPISFPA